jgi:hypothetical protein
MKLRQFFTAFLSTLVLTACGQPESAAPAPDAAVSSPEQVPDARAAQAAARDFVEKAFAGNAEVFVADAARNADRNAYFGDLHVHTAYSFDAFAFGTIATPDDGYRYAKGEAIAHPSGYDVQLNRPLDFYAITDHAGFLGALKEGADPATPLGKLALNEPLHNLNRPGNLNDDSIGVRGQTFAGYLQSAVRELVSGKLDVQLLKDASRSAWMDIVRAAERHNAPNEFTTFVAYEYTSSTDDRGNLHRNVIFRGADRLPEIPFSRFHSQDPAGLWNWMDELDIDSDILDRATGRPAVETDNTSLTERAGSKLSQIRQNDWPTRVLIGGTQDRLIRRAAAVAAVDAEDAPAVQRYLSEMDKSGDPYRHYIRSLASYGGVGMPKNEDAVLGYAEAAVEEGVIEAYPMMNAIYLLGIGVESDPTKAKLWHLRAMEAKLPDSYKMFGDAIINDTYGPINPAFALHVLEHSENRFGDAKRAVLADLLITGAGGLTNLAKAHEIATGLAEIDWDEAIKAKGEALLARPEFATAEFSAEK